LLSVSSNIRSQSLTVVSRTRLW